jgi:hypothetical protein
MSYQVRKLHNEELYDLYYSVNIIRKIKLRRKGWAEHVARTVRREVHTGFWWGNLKNRDHFEDLGLYERLILKCILRNSLVRAWIGLMWLRIGLL